MTCLCHYFLRPQPDRRPAGKSVVNVHPLDAEGHAAVVFDDGDVVVVQSDGAALDAQLQLWKKVMGVRDAAVRSCGPLGRLCCRRIVVALRVVLMRRAMFCGPVCLSH